MRHIVDSLEGQLGREAVPTAVALGVRAAFGAVAAVVGTGTGTIVADPSSLLMQRARDDAARAVAIETAAELHHDCLTHVQLIQSLVSTDVSELQNEPIRSRWLTDLTRAVWHRLFRPV